MVEPNFCRLRSGHHEGWSCSRAYRIPCEIFDNSTDNRVSRDFDPLNLTLYADENQLIELFRTDELDPEVYGAAKSLSGECEERLQPK